MTDNEARDYEALTRWALQLEQENSRLRAMPQPWPSRGTAEPPTLEEVQAGHIHWMMSIEPWGWVQVRTVWDDGIMVCVICPWHELLFDVRVQAAGCPVKRDSVRRLAQWRRCTEGGIPLPLPVWRGPGGETTTKPHPGEPGWVVEVVCAKT